MNWGQVNISRHTFVAGAQSLGCPSRHVFKSNEPRTIGEVLVQFALKRAGLSVSQASHSTSIHAHGHFYDVSGVHSVTDVVIRTDPMPKGTVKDIAVVIPICVYKAGDGLTCPPSFLPSYHHPHCAFSP